MGCLVLAVGLGMVIYQFLKTPHGKGKGKREVASRSMKVGPKGIEFITTYPGMLLIVIGCTMVIASALTSK